ncbi:MAG TPA: hypothetical protein VI504_15290 [Candidatus Eisenbacteria bacterium]|jgi:hypothetical protein
MLARRLTPLRVAALILGALALVPAARAGAPPPLSNPTYGFPLPGDYAAAANAASAGLALSDRWLGESAYENPAASVRSGVEISPLFQRVNRQDLAAKNRDVDQTFGYPDAAGGALSLPGKHWGLVLYAWQPVLRLEQLGYLAGPLVTPAAIQQQALQREVRGGLAISRDAGAVRVGVSGEWVHRDDSYETHEQSGSPSAGDRVLEFKGDAWGGAAGVTWAKDPDRPWGSWFGAAIRYGSELKVTGSVDQRLLDTTGVAPVAATRDAEWSGGVSARVTVAPATRVLLGITGRSGADWGGFDFGTSGGVSWSAGLDWKDPELPWGARFGVGQEANQGAIEKKAGLLSVGFTWVSGDLALDIGLLHRNLARDGSPSSADDRLVGSVKLAF